MLKINETERENEKKNNETTNRPLINLSVKRLYRFQCVFMITHKMTDRRFWRYKNLQVHKKTAHFTLNINLMIKSIKNVFDLICIKKKLMHY